MNLFNRNRGCLIKLIRFVAAGLVFFVLFTMSAQAHATKHHHIHKRHHYIHKNHARLHMTRRAIRPHVQIVTGNIGWHGVRFVRGRLICAINVSNWLRAHGFRSPDTRPSKIFLKDAKVAASNVRYGNIHFNYRKGGGHVMMALGKGSGS